MKSRLQSEFGGGLAGEGERATAGISTVLPLAGGGASRGDVKTLKWGTGGTPSYFRRVVRAGPKKE